LELKPQEETKDAGIADPKPAAAPPVPVPETKSEVDLKTVAQQEANIPLWKDFGYFLLHNKKWWLLPILVILILLSLLMLLSTTAIAPFIYTVF
jgi:hypothetical protein